MEALKPSHAAAREAAAPAAARAAVRAASSSAKGGGTLRRRPVVAAQLARPENGLTQKTHAQSTLPSRLIPIMFLEPHSESQSDWSLQNSDVM